MVTLQTFFKEAGYQVHLLKERAADCPLPMKGHFFFNAWTMATMLAEVLETHETNVDLLILDLQIRWILDAGIGIGIGIGSGPLGDQLQIGCEACVLLRDEQGDAAGCSIGVADVEVGLRRLGSIVDQANVEPSLGTTLDEDTSPPEHDGQAAPAMRCVGLPKFETSFGKQLARLASEHVEAFFVVLRDDLGIEPRGLLRGVEDDHDRSAGERLGVGAQRPEPAQQLQLLPRVGVEHLEGSLAAIVVSESICIRPADRPTFEGGADARQHVLACRHRDASGASTASMIRFA